MARRWIPRFVLLVLVAAAVCWWRQRRVAVEPPPDRDPAAGTPAEPATIELAWRPPVDGACPDGYPVKVAKSGIFHEPGSRSYDRTTPDRCYAAASAAEADGYRRAKA